MIVGVSRAKSGGKRTDRSTRRAELRIGLCGSAIRIAAPCIGVPLFFSHEWKFPNPSVWAGVLNSTIVLLMYVRVSFGYGPDGSGRSISSQTLRAIALYSGKTRDIISAMSYLPEFSPDMWLISIAVPSRPSHPDRQIGRAHV